MMIKKGIKQISRMAIQTIDMFSLDVSFRENG